MENSNRIFKKIDEDFSKIYDEIIFEEKDSNNVVVLTEWKQEGDNFKKFTLYDNNYSPVIISSSTTLICEL